MRKYLPLERVLTGMMEIYEQLLGLEFRPVSDPSVWHESVEMYEVHEDGKLTGDVERPILGRDAKVSALHECTAAMGLGFR